MEPAPGSGRDGRLDAVCRNAIGLFSAVRWPPRRIKLTDGHATVEMEWAADAVLPHQAANRHPEPPAGTSAGERADDRAFTVRSPLVGTFYRAPEPGKPPFVEVGDQVGAGQELGIVEAMKMMNPIEAECDGVVVEILAGNAEFVEYDQPLIIVSQAEST